MMHCCIPWLNFSLYRHTTHSTWNAGGDDGGGAVATRTNSYFCFVHKGLVTLHRSLSVGVSEWEKWVCGVCA